MNLLDALIGVLVAFSVFTGYRRGAALQVVTYSGLILGLLAGALLAPRVAGLAQEPFAQATLALITLLLLAAVGDALGWAIGRYAWAAARRSVLGPVDSAAGSVVAAIAALLTAWFLAFNLVQGPFPPLSREIRRSAVIGAIDAVLPRPPSVLSQVRSFFDRFGFPEVFADLPPAPAGPVQGPTRGQVGGAIAVADQSTLKILGEACGRIQEGSGFVVDGRHVVTNAHVVAGVGSPRVQQQDGGSFPASTMLFDSGLDIAVLRVRPSPAPALQLLPRAVDRGATGAVLGYPRGGGLTGVDAAVRRTMTAIGRDIYGRNTVRRHVYELQATVRPGNSGGPFVTVSGEVAGVVFAASTTNGGVGYAVTSEEVIPRVQRAARREAAVSTGPCIRTG